MPGGTNASCAQSLRKAREIARAVSNGHRAHSKRARRVANLAVKLARALSSKRLARSLRGSETASRALATLQLFSKELGEAQQKEGAWKREQLQQAMAAGIGK